MNFLRGRDGFTLVELLVATAIVVLLLGGIAPAFDKALETVRDLKAIGDTVEKMRSVYDARARAFLQHFAERDPADPPDAVNIDELQPFCDAEATMQKVRDYAEELLHRNRSKARRQRLMEFTRTMDDSLLPALRKMATLLRTRAPGFCDLTP